MKKEKLRGILFSAIKNFKYLKDYKMMGYMGSFTKNNARFGDIDLVSISDLKIHKKFSIYLSNEFKKRKIKIIFFETIINKPKKSLGILLIHDLHYKSIKDLLEKEWKTVINFMRKNIKVIYGKDIISRIPIQKISKERLCGPILKWADRINNYDRYKIFKKHFLLYVLKDFHDYDFEENGDEIKKILLSNLKWKIKIKKIKGSLIQLMKRSK